MMIGNSWKKRTVLLLILTNPFIVEKYLLEDCLKILQNVLIFVILLLIDTLYSYFSNFGVVEDADVAYYRGSRRHRGFGFVVFESPKSVTEIMNQSYHIIDNKRVEITTTENRLAEYPNIKGYESSYCAPQYTISSEMQYRTL